MWPNGAHSDSELRRENLTKLLAEIRACRVCAPYLPHGVRPIIRASKTAKLLIAAQAPGLRVHKTGQSFNDPSGDRLRDWLGVDRGTFYDETRIALVGMAFCFPGYTNGGDRPPPRNARRPGRTVAGGARAHADAARRLLCERWHLGDARNPI